MWHVHERAWLIASFDKTVGFILFRFLALPRCFHVAMTSMCRANIAPRSVCRKEIHTQSQDSSASSLTFNTYVISAPVSIISRSSGIALTQSRFSLVFREQPFTPFDQIRVCHHYQLTTTQRHQLTEIEPELH